MVDSLNTRRFLQRLPFPLRKKGRINIKLQAEPSQSEILDGIAMCLRHAKASKLRFDGDTVAFQVRFLRPVWPWNPLVGVNSGRISLVTSTQGVELRYNLCLIPLVALVVFVLPLIFIILLDSAGVRWTSGGIPLSVLLFLYGWMTVGCYLAVWLRFHCYLRGVVTRILGEGGTSHST